MKSCPFHINQDVLPISHDAAINLYTVGPFRSCDVLSAKNPFKYIFMTVLHLMIFSHLDRYGINARFKGQLI